MISFAVDMITPVDNGDAAGSVAKSLLMLKDDHLIGSELFLALSLSPVWLGLG